MIDVKENLQAKLIQLEDDNSRLERMVERLQEQVKVLQGVFITAGIVIKSTGEIKESVVIFDKEPYSVLRDRK